MKRIRLDAAPTGRTVTRPSAPHVPRSIRVPDGLDARMVDSLENLITGMGTQKDKSRSTTYAFFELNKNQLENAFRSDWIARKCVSIPAQDATRQWRSWLSDNKDIEKLEELEKTLQLQKKTQVALQKARLYGGGALLLGVNQGRLSDPLDVERVGKDALKFVHAVSRWELSAGEMDWDIDSEFYGTPKYYTRSQTGAADPTAKIHPSRVVRFVGNEVPDVTITNGWGDSILQAVSDAIIAAGTACAGGSQLLAEMKMDVIKIPELSDSLSQKQYEKRLSDRFALANMMKSLYNILLLDKDEDWERIEANLTGLPDILRMYLLIASGAADIPATRMLGQSPAGLSATGESDMRNYYDSVKSEQTTTMATAMDRLNGVLIRSALGTTKPGDVTYEWRPLWQLDDEAASKINKAKAESHKIDVEAGLIPAEVMRDARINQLIEDGTYPGLEQIIDDYGPLDDIEEEPEPGAVIGPDGKPISTTDPRHPDNQALLAAQAVQAANENQPPPKKKAGAVDAMAERIRKKKVKRPVYDATPRTLYVYRRVLNAREILAHAKKQGIPDLEPAKELHVTICYSQKPVDWSKAGEDYYSDEKGNLTIKPGGMRMFEKFGNAIVLIFSSSALCARHCQIKYGTDATWDYPEYQPHITVSYAEEQLNLRALEGFTGEIRLGPEVFEEVDPNYSGDERGALSSTDEGDE